MQRRRTWIIVMVSLVATAAVAQQAPRYAVMVHERSGDECLSVWLSDEWVPLVCKRYVSKLIAQTVGPDGEPKPPPEPPPPQTENEKIIAMLNDIVLRLQAIEGQLAELSDDEKSAESGILD